MKKMATLLLAMVLLCITLREAKALSFRDGQTHHIDYEIDEGVYVGGRSSVVLGDGGLITGGVQLDEGYLNIAGGEVWGYVLSDDEDCFITGGTIWGAIYSCDWSNNVSISGGKIHGVINASDAASITIYGTNFNYDYGAIPALSGHLTGVLENGDTISTNFLRGSSYSNIILAAPAEPECPELPSHAPWSFVQISDTHIGRSEEARTNLALLITQVDWLFVLAVMRQ